MSSDEVDRQPDEPNWDAYQADLKVSRMVIKRPLSALNFDIPVPPQPTRYRAGNGPLSEPLDLRPVDDSTAFIVDKVILPLEPFTKIGDPRQRRAYYIIGWPDLPAVRPVVDCTKALDYLSPYAIEQWEHDDLLRREAEKEQAETEAALAAVAQAIAAEKGKGVAGTDVLPDGKKPGRKPKNARLLDVRPPTPQLDSEQEELLAKRRRGPSLSTPQKRKSKIAQLDAEMGLHSLDHMDEYAESDEEIRRQLEREGLCEAAESRGEEDDVVDLLEAGTAAAGAAASPPRTSSARSAPPQGMVPHHRQSLLSRTSRSRRASPPPPSTQQQRPSVIAVSTGQPQIQKRLSTTPIPLPKLPGFGTSSTVLSFPGHPSTVPTPSSQGRAPVTQVATTAFESDLDMARVPSSSEATHDHNGNRDGFLPANSFTPVGWSFPRPPKRPADELPSTRNSDEGAPPNVKVKREHKKKARELSQPPTEPVDPINEPQVEQEYVVKRLEDDTLIDGIQYFKVRWEGDWPPEQNPTWEPRENISAKLVKSYLKRKAKLDRNGPRTDAGGTSSSKSKPKEKHQSTLKRWASNFTYNSVSEAFEGQPELDQMNGKTRNNDDGAGDHDELGGDAEELLVVDKQEAAERERAATERRKSLSAQVAVNLANVGPGKDF